MDAAACEDMARESRVGDKQKVRQIGADPGQNLA